MNNLKLLKPIGLGTGLVEASSSLWKRSAERASVRLGDLVRWAYARSPVEQDNPHYVTAQMALASRMVGIDGIAPIARRYTDRLSLFIDCDRVEVCTMMPFSKVFQERGVIRQRGAWCPLCLRKMLSGPGVFEPLIWRIAAVRVCPVHNIELVTRCPTCEIGHIAPVSRWARVGCCNRCGSWLGSDCAVTVVSGFDREASISREVFHLLGHSDEIYSSGWDGHQTWRKIFSTTEVRFKIGEVSGYTRTRTFQWMHEGRLPELRMLAELSVTIKVPLHRLVLGEIDPDALMDIVAPTVKRVLRNRNAKLLEARVAQVATDPNVSTVVAARELVGISDNAVRRHFPDYVKLIVGRGKEAKLRASAELFRNRELAIRKAFRKITSKGNYPSYLRLARELGLGISRLVAFKDVIDEEWKALEANGNSSVKRSQRGYRSRRAG